MAAKSQKMYIDGKWVDAAGGQTFQDLNPYTGEAYAQVPAGTAEDARSAIDAAKAAFPEWAATPPAAKRKIFLKAADVMDKAGNKAAQGEIAMIKVHAPNMALRIIDDAIQAHGGAGVSQDFDLAKSYAGIRTLRLADGPDEVHARAIARMEYAKWPIG